MSAHKWELDIQQPDIDQYHLDHFFRRKGSSPASIACEENTLVLTSRHNSWNQQGHTPQERVLFDPEHAQTMPIKQPRKIILAKDKKS